MTIVICHPHLINIVKIILRIVRLNESEAILLILALQDWVWHGV